jgi:hypothetical protein
VFYVYTYVSDFGWESAPSPVSIVNTRPSDATVTVGAFAAVPSGNYAIDRLRIYRTQVGASGSAEFFFLREIAIGAADTVDDNRVLGEVMATTTWLPAPADLTWITALWNGMAAGISEGSVRFSEPFVTYAWPIAYDAIPPDGKAVSLGVFGQNLLVLTTGRPLLVSGTSSDSMDQMPLEFSQACVAPRSTVSMGTGVAWASNDGLCWYGASGARILTAGIMTRDDWQALVPSSIIGKMYEGLYFGSYDDGTGRKGFMIEPGSPSGVFFLDAGYTALHFDESQDQLYVLDGVNVQRWDAGTLMTTRARSKIFRAPAALNFGAAEVVAETYPITFRLDAVGMDADEVTTLTTLLPSLFTAPTPTTLRHTVTVTGRQPFRLPAGFAHTDWQMEVETAGAIQGIALASSAMELSQA